MRTIFFFVAPVRTRFTSKNFAMGIAKRPQPRLTEAEKDMIIQSYALGVPLDTIAAQIGKSKGAIKTFYYRYNFSKDLPPKEKASKGMIKSRLAKVVRDLVLGTPKLGLRKRQKQLEDILPEGSWIPSRCTIARFLKNQGFTKRNPSLKAPLSDQNKAKRLAFARK